MGDIKKLEVTCMSSIMSFQLCYIINQSPILVRFSPLFMIGFQFSDFVPRIWIEVPERYNIVSIAIPNVEKCYNPFIRVIPCC